MSALLDRLRYMINDAFGKKTYAESQRDRYKKIVSELQEQLDRTGSLEEALDQLSKDYDIMEVNPDSAQGKLSTTFVTKEAENRQGVEVLGVAFKGAISDVKAKQSFAQGEYQYWCGEADREDREMKVYQQQYYEEERLRREAEERREAEQRAAEQRAANQSKKK